MPVKRVFNHNTFCLGSKPRLMDHLFSIAETWVGEGIEGCWVVWLRYGLIQAPVFGHNESHKRRPSSQSGPLAGSTDFARSHSVLQGRRMDFKVPLVYQMRSFLVIRCLSTHSLPPYQPLSFLPKRINPFLFLQPEPFVPSSVYSIYLSISQSLNLSIEPFTAYIFI